MLFISGNSQESLKFNIYVQNGFLLWWTTLVKFINYFPHRVAQCMKLQFSGNILSNWSNPDLSGRNISMIINIVLKSNKTEHVVSRPLFYYSFQWETSSYQIWRLLFLYVLIGYSIAWIKNNNQEKRLTCKNIQRYKKKMITVGGLGLLIETVSDEVKKKNCKSYPNVSNSKGIQFKEIHGDVDLLKSA